MNMTASVTPWWLQGVRVQSRTVGALIMRELHTRFGRDNIGYLWLFLEPGLLALGITLTRGLARFSPLPWGMDTVSLYVSGYTSYVAFRSAATRSGTTIQANGSLLFHRSVSPIDMVLARNILDTIAPLAAGLLIMLGAAAIGVGRVPGRPLIFFGAWFLNFWFCFGVGLLVLSGHTVNRTVDRFVHPLTYLILPLANVVTIYPQLPPYAQAVMEWVPLAQINEMVREGVFPDFNSPLTHPWYVIAWCMGLTLLGLVGVSAARPKMMMDE